MLAAVYPKRDNLETELYEVADEPGQSYAGHSHAIVAIEWDELRERWDYWHLHEIPANVARW